MINKNNKIPLILYPFIAGIITILLKAVFGSFFSAHALILIALITIIGIKYKTDSPIFVAILTISLLYLYDLIRLKKDIDFGHTPQEIFIGVIFGVVTTLFIYLFELYIIKNEH